MGLEADKSARESLTATARPLVPPGAPVAREPVLFADAGDGGDLLGAGEAVLPLAEICLVPEAQTPFLAGIVGPPGAGKSFILRRLVAAIEALAVSAARTPTAAFHSKIVIASLDAAGVSGDPTSALAAAAFVALERDRPGANYTALADEAAHAASDPRRAAAAAAERHDEISRRLEAERGARDEVESKRARLSEALLYETPGSRIDSFIRTGRAMIDARLRRFGLAEGDSGANYRDLVHDVGGLGAGARFWLVPRAMWAYRGQTRLLIAAVVAFALAFGLGRLRASSADAALKGLSDQLTPVADWLKAHGDLLGQIGDVLIVLGLAALFVNIWRAVSFSTLLFRGLRLLNMDVRDRRRDLDARAARLERRVVGLTAEADAAGKRADSLAKRVGGGASVARAPGPAFLKSLESPAKAAREFFAELGRLMSAPANPNLPVPQRLIVVIDNLEALPPAEAARLIETASALLGAGCIALIACDPAALSRAPRAWGGNLFQVTFDASTVKQADGARLAARLMSTGVASPLPAEIDASRSAAAEPLSAIETALLTALAPLVEASPRALKRFHNAYRLARLAKAPRPMVALALAALQSADPGVADGLREAIRAEGDRFDDPQGPDRLIAATRAARAALKEPVSKVDALAAWDAARRYAPAES